MGSQQQRERKAGEAEGRVVRFPEPEQSGPAAEEEADGTKDISRSDLPPHAATPVAKGLAEIQAVDRSFDGQEFVSGARMAFEMILGAYAKGDLKALRPLLSNEVYEEFAGAVREREQSGEVLETTLVSVKDAEITEAELQGKTAFVSVKFVSEQINIVRNAEGKVIDGAEKRVDTITDLWTFARNTRSRDPNWTLVATDTPD